MLTISISTITKMFNERQYRQLAPKSTSLGRSQGDKYINNHNNLIQQHSVGKQHIPAAKKEISQQYKQ
jgi:hypothetical protein